MSKDNIENILGSPERNFQLLAENINRIMEIGNKNQVDQEISNITEKSINKVFTEKYGHEPVVTEQMIKEFANEVSSNFVKFMYRGQKRNDFEA